MSVRTLAQEDDADTRLDIDGDHEPGVAVIRLSCTDWDDAEARNCVAMMLTPERALEIAAGLMQWAREERQRATADVVADVERVVGAEVAHAIETQSAAAIARISSPPIHLFRSFGKTWCGVDGAVSDREPDGTCDACHAELGRFKKELGAP